MGWGGNWGKGSGKIIGYGLGQFNGEGEVHVMGPGEAMGVGVSYLDDI